MKVKGTQVLFYNFTPHHLPVLFSFTTNDVPEGDMAFHATGVCDNLIDVYMDFLKLYRTKQKQGTVKSFLLYWQVLVKEPSATESEGAQGVKLVKG